MVPPTGHHVISTPHITFQLSLCYAGLSSPVKLIYPEHTPSFSDSGSRTHFSRPPLQPIQLLHQAILFNISSVEDEPEPIIQYELTLLSTISSLTMRNTGPLIRLRD